MLTTGLRIARRTAAINQQSVRLQSSLVGRPRRRMPFAEKAAFGVVMFVSVLATPAYICVNFKNYTGKDEE